MNRRELVNAIAAHTEQEKKTVESVLQGFTDVVLATVATGDPVTISGFAKFAKVQTSARQGRNPATGETIQIAATNAAKVSAGSKLKAAAKSSTP